MFLQDKCMKHIMKKLLVAQKHNEDLACQNEAHNNKLKEQDARQAQKQKEEYTIKQMTTMEAQLL